MNKGTLYLIPSPLGDGLPSEVIPAKALDLLGSIRKYVVEEVRTARRYLSAAGLKGHIDELEFHTLNEHTTPEETASLLSLFDDGAPVGLISEAGLPAVADPGAALVALCHEKGIQVVPLAGPSSIMMALMASGLNGQCFAFNGYLPVKNPDRRNALRNFELRSAREGQSQIFIETPYRNDSLLGDILAVCRPDTKLCIASGITTPDEKILTRRISAWKKDLPQIGKVPCVFILLAAAAQKQNNERKPLA